MKYISEILNGLVKVFALVSAYLFGKRTEKLKNAEDTLDAIRIAKKADREFNNNPKLRKRMLKKVRR